MKDDHPAELPQYGGWWVSDAPDGTPRLLSLGRIDAWEGKEPSRPYHPDTVEALAVTLAALEPLLRACGNEGQQAEVFTRMQFLKGGGLSPTAALILLDLLGPLLPESAEP